MSTVFSGGKHLWSQAAAIPLILTNCPALSSLVIAFADVKNLLQEYAEIKRPIIQDEGSVAMRQSRSLMCEDAIISSIVTSHEYDPALLPTVRASVISTFLKVIPGWHPSATRSR